ncbi:MAG: glycosyltransferase family 4 protein [Bacteroidaceae bacterium]|nr:glycosyltransferase family 4 protein [Bacteroidaceae bacterium]
MRILYISSSNIGGGGSVALFNLIKGVCSLGHEVLVLTPNGHGDFITMLQSIDIQYKQLDLPLSIYPRNKNVIKNAILLIGYLCKLKICRMKVEKEIKTFNPDIVHSNVGVLNIALNACLKLNIPHVWHHREYQDKDFNMHFFPSVKSFLKQIKSAGNYNIVITQGIFQYRGFRNGIDRIIYDGVFDENSIPALKTDKENYILFVGRIEEGKNPDEVISVFEDFHEKYPFMKLLLAGSFNPLDAYYRRCLGKVEKNGMLDSIQFLGVRKDVYELMAKAKMLIMPSKFEGFGFITVEAMLNGCIVIGRNTAGTKEQFDKGLESSGSEIGLRYTTKDELLDLMCYVMEHDTWDMQNRARKVVLNNYSLQKHVANVLNYYHYILSKGSSS